MQRRSPHDDADRIETIHAGSQRAARFETQVAFLQVRIVIGDVRRIAGDKVEALVRQGRKPVAAQEAQPGQRMPGGVLRRHFQRRRTGIDRRDPSAWPLARDRQRDRAGAGAEVEHAGFRRRADPHQRQLDQQLGFRARHQRIGGDDQIERPESALPEDMRNRLALAPTPQQGQETIALFGQQLVVAMREQPGPATAQRVGHQHLGLGARRFAGQRSAGVAQGRGDRAHRPNSNWPASTMLAPTNPARKNK